MIDNYISHLQQHDAGKELQRTELLYKTAIRDQKLPNRWYFIKFCICNYVLNSTIMAIVWIITNNLLGTFNCFKIIPPRFENLIRVGKTRFLGAES